MATKGYAVLFIRRTAPTGRPQTQKVLDKCMFVDNHKIEALETALRIIEMYE